MKKVLLAFSGGLDTSFFATYLKEQGYEVHTALANTGGFDAEELKVIEEKAKKLIDGGYAGKDVIMGIRPEDIYDGADELAKFSGSVIEADVTG